MKRKYCCSIDSVFKIILFLFLFTSVVSCNSGKSGAEAYKHMGISMPENASPLLKNMVLAFTSRIAKQSECKVSTGDAPFVVRLTLKSEMEDEAFSIEDIESDIIEISAKNDIGLMYGMGKMLHTSKFENGAFIPGTWRGYSSPVCKVRGIYMACHFNNFYEVAPVDEINAYIEDLAFAGMNTIIFNFPQWQYDSFDDTLARKNLERIKLLIRSSKNIGLKAGMLECENQGFKTAPANTRFVKYPDDLGRRGYLGVSLCASKKQGVDYLMNFWNKFLDEFNETGLDYLVFWPYDEGGCGCRQCWPWGAKGHVSISAKIMELAHTRWPECKSILSTWMYDTPEAGEWEGLYKALKNDSSLFDCIMADAHEDFPRYPLENKMPDNRPILNFPEISMWGLWPWGGYGASPLPARFHALWNQLEGKADGGFPYSEGIYEDFNKYMCLRLYWQPDLSAQAICDEYVAAYFSPNVVEKVSKAIQLMEKTHNRNVTADGKNVNIHNAADSVQLIFDLIKQADGMLNTVVRESWRWRIIYLRAQIDDILIQKKGRIEGEELRKAFNELIEIYHSQTNHTSKIGPPDFVR